MIKWVIRKLWGRNNDGWQKAIMKRRDFLQNHGSPVECQLFLMRLQLQESSSNPKIGHDAPYTSCQSDDTWRKSLQARRRFIFSNNKSLDEIWGEYKSFSDLISEQILVTENILANRINS